MEPPSSGELGRIVEGEGSCGSYRRCAGVPDRARASLHGSALPERYPGWALDGVWGSICLAAGEVYRRLQESKSGDGPG